MRRRAVMWAVLAVAAVCVLALVVQRGRASSASKTPERAGAGAGGGGPGGPVPVVAGVAERKDVPEYLEGVGTVLAYQTVTVRARVDGQLVKVGFNEGQEVKPGDLLAVIDPRPFEATLGQMLAKKGQDEAVLANSKRDLERYRLLVQQNLLQRQMLDTQEAQVAQQEALVRGDEAAVESARVQLAYTRITSPIPGRTGLRQVDPGNIVHASDANGIVIVTQLQPISVLFTIPEQHVGAINEEQAKQHLPVDAIAADNQKVLDQGELVLVDNQIDPTTGTVRLKAVFPNAARRLWPGQFVNARLRLRVRQGGTVVPAPAIQRGPQGTFVYVIKSDNTVEMRPLKVAQTQAGEALVDEGIAVGERVVVEGQYKLQPGSRVVVQAPGGEQRGPGVGQAPGAGAGEQRGPGAARRREPQGGGHP